MKHQASINTEKLYNLLENFCEEVSINLVFEEGDFRTGFCKVNGQSYIFINKNITKELKVNNIIKALKEADLSNIFIKPAIRELLEEQDNKLF